MNDKALKQLRWLAEHGATFCLPAGRTKGQLPAAWQKTPKTLAEAELHAQHGGNVGLLCGAPSGGIVAIDVDADWADQIAVLGDFAQTVTVQRDNAPGRGKLLYRVTSDPPRSRPWKKHATDEHPSVELLSTGRHALIPPSQYEDGAYLLHGGKHGIRTVTGAELEGVWFLLTGETFDHVARQAGLTRSPFVAAVKGAWTPEAVFQHFGKAGTGTSQERAETRILGNAGLLVKGDLWYCHGDGMGGDAIDAWHWCETGRRLDRNDQAAFWRTVEAMAQAAGIEKPDAQRAASEEPGDEPEPDGDLSLPHPLRSAQAVDLATLQPRLGWLHDCAEYAAAQGNAPYEFGLLTALAALAAASAGQVKLSYPIPLRPNLYGAIVAPSSVYRKSTTIAAIYSLFREAEIMQAVIGTSITAEALIEQLSERAKLKDLAGNVIGEQPAAGLLVQMELRDVLRSDRVKYSVLLKNTLTELYDGYPMKRRLRSGTHEFQESALSIIGGTVPDTVFEDMSDEDWKSGFAARWLFVTTNQEPDFDTPIDADSERATEAMRTRQRALAGLLRTVHAMPGSEMSLSPKALALWDARRRETERAAHLFDNDLLRYTVTRLNTTALKFAMLINLATAGADWPEIDTHVMETALLLTDFFKAKLADLLDLRERKAKHNGALQRVLSKIASANKEGANPTTRDIQRRFDKLDSSTLQLLLDELYRRGAVVVNNRRYTAIHDRLPVSK